MAKGKALTFPEKMSDQKVLEKAKEEWLKRHTEVNEDGSRAFKGNNKYTPFQGRRGKDLILFVWGNGELTMFKASASLPCGPRMVWE